MRSEKLKTSTIGTALSIGAGVVLLAGCGVSQVPMAAPGMTLEQRIDPARAPKQGIYVYFLTPSLAPGIYGYSYNDSKNKPPLCTVSGVPNAGGAVVDGNGNLMVPTHSTRSAPNAILIFKGPRMCGAKLGSLNDPYGSPVDAVSFDAVKGTIVVANVFDGQSAGSVSICTLKAGCTKNLTNRNMWEVASVAVSPAGDCWASAVTPSTPHKATLIWFKSCAGSGKVATGYKNTYYGGLDVDSAGNILSLSFKDAEAFVYSGCRPKCKLVGGPFVLHGDTTYAHLNKSSTELVGADYGSGPSINSTIDIYQYSPTKITYEFSFNNGISKDLVSSAAFDPHSSE
jgi:hypothetical protein